MASPETKVQAVHASDDCLPIASTATLTSTEQFRFIADSLARDIVQSTINAVQSRKRAEALEAAFMIRSEPSESILDKPTMLTTNQESEE